VDIIVPWLMVAMAAAAAGGPPPEGAELIGKPAPAWAVDEWIGSPPLTLASLRGKVVLVRWFMSTECPYCSATAPALNQLHDDYAARGLAVIGMYHHKRPEPLQPGDVAKWAREFGFEFPVAIDPEWRTLKRWWLDGHKRAFTSVTFLIDRHGIIRHIHPGGRMAPHTPDYAAMRAKIETLLAER
jgi:peroxiredoxin